MSVTPGHSFILFGLSLFVFVDIFRLFSAKTKKGSIMKKFDGTDYVIKHANELREQIPVSVKEKHPRGFMVIPDESDLKTIDGSRLLLVVDPDANISRAEYVFCNDWSLRRRENAPKFDKDNACAVVYMRSLHVGVEKPKSLVHLAASIPSHPFSNL